MKNYLTIFLCSRAAATSQAQPIANTTPNTACDYAFAIDDGARLLLALDVSRSMAAGGVAGSSLTPREASAAMALMTAATEANTHITCFTGGMVPCRHAGRRWI